MANSRLILAFAVLLVAFMLWPLTFGELWIIDDHEIVYQAHQYDSLKPANIFSRYTTILLQTEVGSPATAGRYRPIYYAVRTLKSALMGANAKAWFLVNAIYCFVGLAALGLALGRFFPWYVTLPFMALTMALPIHCDLWPRLGPAEIDAFTYCMVFCFAASRLREKKLWAWPCCAIAVALAIGCKENFLLLLLPLGMLAIYGSMRKNIQPRRLWWLLFPVLIALPVAYTVIRTIKRTSNIYGQDTSPQSLLSTMISFFTSRGFFYCAVCFAALLLVYVIARNQSQSAFLRKLLPLPLKSHDIYCSLAVLLALTALIGGNYLFYSGRIWIVSRYAFPYYFFLCVLPLCPLYPLVPNIASRYALSRILKSAVTILGIMAIIVLSPFIYENMSYTKRHIQITIDFQHALKEAKGYREIFLINPGEPLVSYEPYFSLKRYEEAGYLPPFSYFPLFADSESGFQKGLENHLRSAVSKQPPLVLTPDVLLWKLDYNGQLQKIEHTRDNRDIRDLLTASQALSKDDDLAYIASPTVFYIPMDDPDITGMILTECGENDLAAWRISVNDHVIAEENITYGKDSFTITLPAMSPGDFSHPQLYKLYFEPKEASTPALCLRSLILLHNVNSTE